MYDVRDGPELVDETVRAPVVKDLVRECPLLLLGSSLSVYDVARDCAGSDFGTIRNDACGHVKFLAAQYDEQARNGRWFLHQRQPDDVLEINQLVDRLAGRVDIHTASLDGGLCSPIPQQLRMSWPSRLFVRLGFDEARMALCRTCRRG